MDSERRKREKEIERLVSGIPASRDSEAAFREEVRKAASELFHRETRRIEEDERLTRSPRRKAPRLRTWGIGLIILGAIAVVLEVPAVGGLLVVAGLILILWDTVGTRPYQRRFSSKGRPGRFEQRL